MRLPTFWLARAMTFLLVPIFFHFQIVTLVVS
ncbi:hypothetical protein LINPERHAP1_LOCUS32058 [Linum perenne]